MILSDMHLNCVAHGTLNLKQIITRSVTMHSKIPLCCVPSDTELVKVKVLLSVNAHSLVIWFGD